MSVNVVVCEGGPQSPDVRVLSKLLAGLCEVRPFGSRFGMGDRIKGMRQHSGPVVFGVLDGDFRDLNPVARRPRSWLVEGQLFGWRWERKEIENYLLDADVMSRSLGASAPPVATWLEILRAAGERIAAYEAARTCLGLLQRHYRRPLETSFGRPRGSDNHRFPEALDEASCRTELLRTVGEYQSGLAFDEQCFDQLLMECSPGGPRLGEFLTYFAGKDLLWAIDEPLQELGIPSCGVLRERILLGIEQALDPVETWVPEWGVLRNAVVST